MNRYRTIKQVIGTKLRDLEQRRGSTSVAFFVAMREDGYIIDVEFMSIIDYNKEELVNDKMSKLFNRYKDAVSVVKGYASVFNGETSDINSSIVPRKAIVTE